VNPVLVAPASFKGTLSSVEICRAVEAALRRRNIPCRSIPLADGGNGTLDAFVAIYPDARFRKIRVTGPIGRPVRARVLVRPGQWFIEMAEAAGLHLMSRPDPWTSTTYGVGELIRRAGDSEIFVGLGGSATNDAGAGALTALGARMFDSKERPIPRGGGGLEKLARIDWPQIPRPRLVVLTDVDNPLLGRRGASRVYGPQKGASPAMIRRLEANLTRFARIVRRDLGIALDRIEGGGAAGGLGSALIGILGGVRRRGAEELIRRSGLKRGLAAASGLVTGEGKLDSTTFQGKAVGELCNLARRLKVPLFLICGVCEPAEDALGAAAAVELRSIRGARQALRAAASSLASAVASHLRA
jgi:glycerate kinase